MVKFCAQYSQNGYEFSLGTNLQMRNYNSMTIVTMSLEIYCIIFFLNNSLNSFYFINFYIYNYSFHLLKKSLIKFS